jgi:hypothetical protein
VKGAAAVVMPVPQRRDSVRIVPDTIRRDSVIAGVPDSDKVALKDSIGHIIDDREQDRDSLSVRAVVKDSFPAFLHRSVTEGKVSLVLRGVYLRDGMLWLSLLLRNDSRIGYCPEYARSFIREKRKIKRMAVQEIPVEPVCRQLPPMVAGKTGRLMNLGFRSFTLEKTKVLILQVAEKDGGRQLSLSLPAKLLLKAK